MRKYVTFLIGIALAACQSISAQTPVRKVLLEEYTTASCGNCPMMSKHLNTWQLANSGTTILVAIHQGSGNDAMSNGLTTAIFNAMHPAAGWFAPAIMIDRGIYPWVDPEPYLSTFLGFGSGPNPGIDTIATRLMNEPVQVGVNISGTYNATTRTINATVNASFVSALPSGDWRINLFLIEDSVIGYPNLGAFVGWDQHCYDATWANSNYPGMFDGTSIIGYPHRHVMRSSFFGNWGIQGIIPPVPGIGSTYSATGSLVVDTAFKENNLRLVAFVSSYGAAKSEKFIVNANDVELTSSFATGINDNSPNLSVSGPFIDNVFPVPSSGQAKIIYSLTKAGHAEISIHNLYGQKTDVLFSSFSSAGKHEITFDASTYAKGIYFLSLNAVDGSQTKKIIID